MPEEHTPAERSAFLRAHPEFGYATTHAIESAMDEEEAVELEALELSYELLGAIVLWAGGELGRDLSDESRVVLGNWLRFAWVSGYAQAGVDERLGTKL